MDMKLLMRQAQEMQSKIKKAQDELASKEYEGSAGGGMVKVKILGSGVVQSINIDNSIISAEEKEIMEDLIVAAINDAKKNVDSGSDSIMKDITGGLNLPGGFKL